MHIAQDGDVCPFEIRLYGHELRIFARIRFVDGSSELIETKHIQPWMKAAILKKGQYSSHV